MGTPSLSGLLESRLDGVDGRPIEQVFDLAAQPRRGSARRLGAEIADDSVAGAEPTAGSRRAGEGVPILPPISRSVELFLWKTLFGFTLPS